MSEVQGKAACNSMSNSVAAGSDGKSAMPMHARAQEFGSPRRGEAEAGLYAADGARKYLNQAERQSALAAMAALPADQALFALTLAWTGARVSEVLALTPSSFQVEAGLVAIRTLKRRRHHVREVPLPPHLMAALDRHFHLSIVRRDPRRVDRRLWPWHRATAWRLIKRVMNRIGVHGRRACPRGLRHAFGVATLGIVPLNVRQKWLGHARPETTDIYSAVCGPEEIAFARQLWRCTSVSKSPHERTPDPSAQTAPDHSITCLVNRSAADLVMKSRRSPNPIGVSLASKRARCRS
jgi:integrase/recombinase XerD